MRSPPSATARAFFRDGPRWRRTGFCSPPRRWVRVPERCAVFDDSVAGVRAGSAAGIDVFGYAARVPEARLREAGAASVFKHTRLLELLAGAQAYA